MYLFLIRCTNVQMYKCTKLTYIKKKNGLTSFNVIYLLFTLFFPNLHVEFANMFPNGEIITTYSKDIRNYWN